jgi:hypothetical protein
MEKVYGEPVLPLLGEVVQLQSRSYSGLRSGDSTLAQPGCRYANRVDFVSRSMHARLVCCAVRVTAEAARRFLVARHFLAPARSLTEGAEAVLQVFRKFGSIQFDPIAVAGRNHDLVLRARVAGYEPAWCDVAL